MSTHLKASARYATTGKNSSKKYIHIRPAPFKMVQVLPYGLKISPSKIYD